MVDLCLDFQLLVAYCCFCLYEFCLVGCCVDVLWWFALCLLFCVIWFVLFVFYLVGCGRFWCVVSTVFVWWFIRCLVVACRFDFLRYCCCGLWFWLLHFIAVMVWFVFCLLYVASLLFALGFDLIAFCLCFICVAIRFWLWGCWYVGWLDCTAALRLGFVRGSAYCGSGFDVFVCYYLVLMFAWIWTLNMCIVI